MCLSTVHPSAHTSPLQMFIDAMSHWSLFYISGFCYVINIPSSPGLQLTCGFPVLWRSCSFDQQNCPFHKLQQFTDHLDFRVDQLKALDLSLVGSWDSQPTGSPTLCPVPIAGGRASSPTLIHTHALEPSPLYCPREVQGKLSRTVDKEQEDITLVPRATLPHDWGQLYCTA